MARIGETLGWSDNPLYRTLGANRNALTQFGAGLAADGWGGAAQGLAQGALQDDAFALVAEERALQQEQQNQTTEWLKANYPQYAGLPVEQGFQLALSDMSKTPQGPTSNMQDYLFAQENPGYAEFLRGGQRGDLPADYQNYILSQTDPGYAAFRATQPGPMNSTVQNAILEADGIVEASQSSVNALNEALALNEQAYDGPFAGGRAQASALFGDQGGQATLDLQNIVTSNALSSLKAIFGAAPTEGERKILLDIQGSVDQPRAVREAIFNRAIAAANRRMQINQQKAEELRAGKYFLPATQQPTNGGQTSTGVTWSIEP